jgi:archaeoflavoprotein AfpA
MNMEKKRLKKPKIAWGITGGGDRIIETLQIMTEIKDEYKDCLELRVYLSKAGEQVCKHYGIYDGLKRDFASVQVERDSNTPFLAGTIQTGQYKFLLIAPVTSNTVAKIALGIGDTLLTNSASMALKAYIPVYIMPTDYKEGPVTTKLPNGKPLSLRVRKEDAERVQKLATMDGVKVLEKPEHIPDIFKKHFEAKSFKKSF